MPIISASAKIAQTSAIPFLNKIRSLKYVCCPYLSVTGYMYYKSIVDQSALCSKCTSAESSGDML